ncbi:hypothetical protein R6Q57_008343 [Mikania cordata]
MALKLPAVEAANVAIQSIGCGYDILLDLRLKYCKHCPSSDSSNRLIEIDEVDGRDIVLPGGLLISNVAKSIHYDKGQRTRFRSDVLSFQQMSEQFNHELSLPGKIPSGLFNTMFEFSGNWQKDASRTKTLACEGMFISLYTIALEKSHILLCDHVKKAVPSSWEPALLARFIERFGTHIIVDVSMGGKDVIYMKQHRTSSLHPADVQKRLEAMADRRFMDVDGQCGFESEHFFESDKVFFMLVCLFISLIKNLVSICKRRGGSGYKNLKHSEWLHSVQLEPDVIKMSFIPITSLLNGVSGSGYLSHAINLYLRYKPPIEELQQFLEFQVPRQWAPVFIDLPLGPHCKLHSMPFLQFTFCGTRLYVNTNPVDVGKRPVTGLQLSLEGKKSNCLSIHLQHLSSLPNMFQLEDDPHNNFTRETYDHRYNEKVHLNHFSHVCTAPVESENELSVLTGACLEVKGHGFKKVLFLRVRFSTAVGVVPIKHPEWDGSCGLTRKSGLISSLISHHLIGLLKPSAQQPAEEVNINSAVYPGGPPAPDHAPKLLKFVDTVDVTRGPQESPGYWVVSGAKLVVDKGKIALRVKYSLLTPVLHDERLVI